MHPTTRFALSALVLGAVSSFASAADVQHNRGSLSPVDFRAMQVHGTAVTTALQTSEYFANPFRDYPPSCLNSPLPGGLYVNDPAKLTTTINLPGDPLSSDANERAYTETDTVTIFRVPCGPSASAVLLEIDRPSTASITYYPVFPGVLITTTNGDFVPRLAEDPNTVFSNTFAFNPVQDAVSVYIFENYAINGVALFDYDQALPISVNNLQSGAAADTANFSVPAYNPNAYAANAQPLPISGYQSGNFYDPTHGGEGIQVEVAETSTVGVYVMTIAWYTFDESGVPFWLFGTGTFNTGATSANVQMIYETNGGFAGNFTATSQVAWGTLTNVNFPDCNTMRFTYTANPGLPSGVPTGSGTKQWTRLTQINGLTCQ